MAERKLKKYELVYVLQPEIPDEDRNRIDERIGGVFEKVGAHILKREEWGKRKLAYEIEKFNKGIYYYYIFAAYSDAPLEIERNLRLLDSVIRFMTIKLDDDISLEAAKAEIAEEQAQKAARLAARQAAFEDDDLGIPGRDDDVPEEEEDA